MSQIIGWVSAVISLIAVVVAVAVCRSAGRRLKKECVGYLLIDESDPDIDKGGGVYLQLFDIPSSMTDRSIVKIEIRKVNASKEGGHGNG